MPPTEHSEIVLDIDSTEDRTYGQQAFTFFNAHYNTYMYHPLLIFEGQSGLLLSGRLRPGNASGARQAVELLRPLVRRLRARFPHNPLALRGDSAFATPAVLAFADYAGLTYAIGFGRNDILVDRVIPLCQKAEDRWERTLERVRLYSSFWYKARTWSTARRVVAKVERTREGVNLRFVVTNRRGKPEDIFAWYEQRGQAENYIKELKNDLSADRLSCSAYRANAFRLQLHALAYNLLVLFRHLALAGGELASRTTATLRLRLFKVGARVKRSVRRLWFHLASGWPGQPLFLHAADRLRGIGPPG